MAIGKATAHLCLILIVKELKTSVEQGRVVTTLNKIKHEIECCDQSPITVITVLWILSLDLHISSMMRKGWFNSRLQCGSHGQS